MSAIGSLFSGIGGLERGLESIGLGPVIWQAESDPFARAVLAKHWPDVRRYDDVKEIDETAPKPDIICGGFPCQDISDAGKRAGIDGERSGLWREFARIIRVVRPRLVFVENVAALLDRGMGRVLADLAALGFDAEWGVFKAAHAGAPHDRERIFILAYSDGARPQGKDWQAVDRQGAAGRTWWLREPAVARVVNGLPGRVDRTRVLGNAVVPQQAALAFLTLAGRTGSGT